MRDAVQPRVAAEATVLQENDTKMLFGTMYFSHHAVVTKIPRGTWPAAV